MNEPDLRTIAWIFYALAGASGSEPANRRLISQIADGINHAVPTEQELNGSLRSLQSLGLVGARGKAFFLTPAGLSLVSSASLENNTTLGVWHAIADELSHRTSARL